MHRWLNAIGDAVHHLQPRVCDYPHQPDSIRVLGAFQAPENHGENLATRIEVSYSTKL